MAKASSSSVPVRFNVEIGELAGVIGLLGAMKNEVEGTEFAAATSDTVLNRSRVSFYHALDQAAMRSAEGEGGFGSVGREDEGLGRLHHVYEWGETGRPYGRLVRLVFPRTSRATARGTGWLSEGRVDYVPSTKPVPYRGGPLSGEKTEHIFTEKARVMEEMAGAMIAPRSKPRLYWWDDAAEHLRSSAKPMFVSYRQTQGKFAEFFNEFWASGLGEKLAVEPVGVAINEYFERNFGGALQRAAFFRSVGRTAAGGVHRMDVGRFDLTGVYTISGVPVTTTMLKSLANGKDASSKAAARKELARLIKKVKGLKMDVSGI